MKITNANERQWICQGPIDEPFDCVEDNPVCNVVREGDSNPPRYCPFTGKELKPFIEYR